MSRFLDWRRENKQLQIWGSLHYCGKAALGRDDEVGGASREPTLFDETEKDGRAAKCANWLCVVADEKDNDKSNSRSPAGMTSKKSNGDYDYDRLCGGWWELGAGGGLREG
jgi:hypothetical protein